jgi:anti-sigma factor RsiW
MRVWYSGKTLKKLADYLDGTMSEEDRQEFESHELCDPRTMDRVNNIRALTQDLRSLPKTSASGTFKTVLRAQLRREERSSNLFSSVFRPRPAVRMIGFAAMAFFFVSIGLIVGRVTQAPQANQQLEATDTLMGSSVSPLLNPVQTPPPSNNGQYKNYMIEHVVYSDLPESTAEADTRVGNTRIAEAERDSTTPQKPQRVRTQTLTVNQANRTVEF